jgi:hypothetical protein
MGPKKGESSADNGEVTSSSPMTLEIGTGKFILDEAHGWFNKLEELKAEAAKLKPCTIQMHPRIRADEAIASPEAFDRQTDVTLQAIVPPTEVSKMKQIKKASELTDAERVAVADTLLSYFTMYCRGTSCHTSFSTCFYVHEPSYAEGDAIGLYMLSLQQLMVLATNIIDSSGVRDGEEEFGFQYVAHLATSAVAAGNVDLEKIDAESNKETPLSRRFAVLAGLARYFIAATNVGKRGAISTHEELSAAVDGLASSIKALENDHPSGAAVVPPPAAFTSHAALWDTMSIPFEAVQPCLWSDVTNYLTALCNDTKVLYTEWLPLKTDLLAVFECVKAYCHREPQPSLVARSVASIFVMHGQQPFGGDSVLLLLLGLLRDRFGAPWYSAVVRPQTEDEQRAAKLIVEHAAKQNSGESSRAASQQMEDEVRRQIVIGVSTTVLEIGRLLNHLMTAYLKNRGRCHRTLMNLLPAIVGCQTQAWRVERSSFLAASQTNSKAWNPALARNEVLFSILTDILFDTCQQICLLTQKLGLLTTPELAPSWCTTSTSRRRAARPRRCCTRPRAPSRSSRRLAAAVVRRRSSTCASHAARRRILSSASRRR